MNGSQGFTGAIGLSGPQGFNGPTDPPGSIGTYSGCKSHPHNVHQYDDVKSLFRFVHQSNYLAITSWHENKPLPCYILDEAKDVEMVAFLRISCGASCVAESRCALAKLLLGFPIGSIKTCKSSHFTAIDETLITGNMTLLNFSLKQPTKQVDFSHAHWNDIVVQNYISRNLQPDFIAEIVLCTPVTPSVCVIIAAYLFCWNDTKECFFKQSPENQDQTKTVATCNLM